MDVQSIRRAGLTWGMDARIQEGMVPFEAAQFSWIYDMRLALTAISTSWIEKLLREAD